MGFKQAIRLMIICLGLFFLAQGCGTKENRVPLIMERKAPASCEQLLAIDIKTVSDDDLFHALDNASSGLGPAGCWGKLMKKALGADRQVPMDQLKKAIHVFNRNDGKQPFSTAIYLYFKGMIEGRGRYGDLEKKLMTHYLSFAINTAGSKQDDNLEKAKLVCLRLDPSMYKKYFR